jgi:hypothetical protein
MARLGDVSKNGRKLASHALKFDIVLSTVQRRPDKSQRSQTEVAEITNRNRER